MRALEPTKWSHAFESTLYKQWLGNELFDTYDLIRSRYSATENQLLKTFKQIETIVQNQVTFFPNFEDTSNWCESDKLMMMLQTETLKTHCPGEPTAVLPIVATDNLEFYKCLETRTPLIWIKVNCIMLKGYTTFYMKYNSRCSINYEPGSAFGSNFNFQIRFTFHIEKNYPIPTQLTV